MNMNEPTYEEYKQSLEIIALKEEIEKYKSMSSLEEFENLLPELLGDNSVKDILASLVDAINDKCIALDEEEYDLFTRLDWEQDQINKIIPFIED